MKIFSDTIIITMEAEIQAKETLAKETDTLLLEMSRLIGPMILKGIYDGIYLRGAISVGKFYQSDSLIIGPAVDEAAEWLQTTEWIGVSTSPTAHYTIEKLAELNKTDLSKRYIRYNVPTKIGIKKIGGLLIGLYGITTFQILL